MMSGGTAWSTVRVLCYQNRDGSRGGNHLPKKLYVGCRYLMVNYLVLVAVRDWYEVCCVRVGLRE